MNKSLFILLLMSYFSGMAYSVEWHTSPNKWKEPRNFHTQFDTEYENRIQITKVKNTEEAADKTFSPNKVYWFELNLSDTAKPGPWSADIVIFNEREYLIKIRIIDYAAGYSLKAKWINEKLLYVQFWFGRIMGAYFIFDAEKEEILIKEMTWDGNQVFKQFQQGNGK